MKRIAIFLLLTAIGACRPVLQGELTENEANEMLAALLEQGLAGEKSACGDGRYEIRVGRDEFWRAWQILRERGLPRRQHAGLRQAYRERSLVPGRVEEQAVLVAALQEELEETLESISGVVSARVHLTLAGGSERGGEAPAPSASILLMVLRRPPPLEESEVQRLVAHAVQGLEPQRVAVVVLEAAGRELQRPPPPPAGTTLAAIWPLGGALLLAGAAAIWLLIKRRQAAGRVRLLP
jgi:type III secretion protein J